MMPHTHMLRKKIKLITLDLDNTVWPNNKVIVEAEKAMWDFVFAKFPEIYNEYDDKRISEIRVTLVEKNPNLKFDLTSFRKEIIKYILQEVGAKMQKLLLKDSLEKQRLLLFQMEMQTLSLLV